MQMRHNEIAGRKIIKIKLKAAQGMLQMMWQE